MNTMSAPKPVRRCTECGQPQTVVRQTVMYPESGLSNVQLSNVPVWMCVNRHEEVEIPRVQELHELMAHLILRKPAAIVGPEIKFLRRRVAMSAKDFAVRIGLSAVRLSQIENAKRPIPKRVDLLIRLSIAALIAARDAKPFPNDLAHFIDQLEQSWDLGTHRLTHHDNALPDHAWQETAN